VSLVAFISNFSCLKFARMVMWGGRPVNVGVAAFCSKDTWHQGVKWISSPPFFFPGLTKSNSKKNQKNETDQRLTTAPFLPNPISMHYSRPPAPSTRNLIPFAKKLLFWQCHGMTHIKANAVMLPESAFLLHHECIFCGKMLMDHNATKYNTTINQKWAAKPAPLAK
jgi:hypothetical protein